MEGERASDTDSGVLSLVLLIVAWMIVLLLTRSGYFGA